MRKIITKTVTQQIYVGESGKETPVEMMDPKHLVNAFGKAVSDENGAIAIALKAEIVRRLTGNFEGKI